MTGTGEVTKRRVIEGRGEFPVDCPLEDCAVRVHYKATLAGTDKVDSHFLESLDTAAYSQLNAQIWEFWFLVHAAFTLL